MRPRGGAWARRDRQFYYPSGIAADSAGNVYVADTYNNRVQKFTSSGAFVTKWGGEGAGNGQFVSVCAIAVDGAGNVYVGDQTMRIQKFSSTGTYLTQWGSYGTGNGKFMSLGGIAADGSGNVYVVDTTNNPSRSSPPREPSSRNGAVSAPATDGSMRRTGSR